MAEQAVNEAKGRAMAVEEAKVVYQQQASIGSLNLASQKSPSQSTNNTPLKRSSTLTSHGIASTASSSSSNILAAMSKEDNLNNDQHAVASSLATSSHNKVKKLEETLKKERENFEALQTGRDKVLIHFCIKIPSYRHPLYATDTSINSF